MLPSHLTPRKKSFIRLTLFVTTACLMIATATSFNASAQGAEAGLWRRFINAPITTVQQVFGLSKSPTAAAPAPMFATITVNSTVDGPMATLNANTTCDLREAIVAANNNAVVGQCAAGAPGLDTIEFNIGTGTPTIAIALDGAMMPQSLPNIIEPIIINGATGGATRVEINGTNATPGLAGLFLNGTGTNGSTIQSLVLNRFPGNGITISNSKNNTIRNCYIGTNAAGTMISANTNNGITISGGSENNTIGGATVADRNIISGNGSAGVFIFDDNTKGNIIAGNYIGTNATGTAAIANTDSGVFIKSPGNTVDRNVISGNRFDGVFIQLPTSTGNIVTGNYIGTNAAGTAAIPNANDGLLLSNAPNNIIGGTTVAERNIISGNNVRGIWVFGANATGNKIRGNYVGTDVTGTLNITNGSHGIMLQDAPNNTVGGTALNEGNTIAFNSDPLSVGVRVVPSGTEITAKGNAILGNSIFGNGLRGIALAVTSTPYQNDPMDADTGDNLMGLPEPFTNRGGNNLQNYPVLSCAVSGSGTTTVKGTLNSLASTKFRIEFFSNDACHPVGNGEGKVYLGFQNVTTDASGNATINAPLAATVAPGKVITSTATKLGTADAPVETSEFSACQAVTAAPTLAINSVTTNEGNAGTTNFVFTVTLTAPSSCGDVTVNYATADNTATIANADYATTSGTLTFTGANLTQTITVLVNGDMTVEPMETFFVNLINASGAGITTAQGVGTITNDDAATIAINDAPAVTEGNSGTVNATFTVTLSKPSSTPVTVQYATADGTAAAPSDYTAAALTTLTFNPNETSKQINVAVNGDMSVEANETFVVNLSNATGATISDNQGQGTINNDDAATVAINDVTVTEGNSGTVNANFNITLSNPSSEQVTVTYATANGTATTADSDYVAVAAGTVIFAAGETSKTVAITVNGDTKVEANETFTVTLSSIVGNNANVADPTLGKSQGTGTINNDDAATVAINDVMVTEGNSSTVNAVFSVSLSAPADQAVVVNFATAPGSATASADYMTTNGSVTFPANSNAAQTITVQVVGETLAEGDETFAVNLTPNSLPAGVTIADAQGIGTIKDDDSTQAPALTASMSDPFVCNGVGGPVQVTAELTNPNPNSQSATFAVTLPSSLTAVANSCTATTGTCTVALPNQINWSGTLAAGQKVTISYRATVANGTPNGQLIVINSTGTIAGQNTSVSASGTVSCPPNTAPTTISASGQKAGSILVFPYYTSKASTKADTRLTLSNVGAAQTIVHLFLIAGSNCQQADLYVCLTPYASISIKASDYDPETTGWMMAVAVDKDGFPVQNNALVGNAFLKEDNYIDNYSAVSFAARSADVATRGGNNTAVLQFNNSGYDAVPDQFAVELQSPLDAVGQRVVTVGLSGNLNNSALSGASQIGTGLVINGNEKPLGSFVAWLSGGCQAMAMINTSAPRVPGGMNTMIPKGQVGTMFFRIGSGVGLIMSPRGNAWSGIRGLQFTHETFTTITIPVFSPSC